MVHPLYVSTHSRPKAAARHRRPFIYRVHSFNTQPPEGGCQFSITIRKPMSKNLTLEEYQESGFFDDIVIGEHFSEEDIKLAEYLENRDFLNFFKLAVASGLKNIAIAGATG